MRCATAIALTVLLSTKVSGAEPPFAITCAGMTETVTTGAGGNKKKQTHDTDTWVVNPERNTVGRVVENKFIRDACDVSGTCVVKIDSDFITVKFEYENDSETLAIKISDYLSINRRTGDGERFFNTKNDLKSVGLKTQYDSTTKYTCRRAPLPDLPKAVI